MDRSPPGKQPQKARCEQLVAVNQRLHRRRVGGGLELLHDAIDPLRNDLPDYFTCKVLLTHHLPKMWPWYMGAYLPSTDPVSVEATIDSYRRLGHKSSLLALAARKSFSILRVQTTRSHEGSSLINGLRSMISIQRLDYTVSIGQWIARRQDSCHRRREESGW